MNQDSQNQAPWLMRVDSRPEAGKGHVARSAVLAKALARYAPVAILLDGEVGAWQPRLQGDGVRVYAAGGQPRGPWQACIIDGYDFADSDINTLCAPEVPLIAFDDFLDPPKRASLVINSALHLEGDNVNGTPALLGPQYALIDPVFCRGNPFRNDQASEHIVVTFGAIDRLDATSLSLQALAVMKRSGRRFRTTVVASRAMSNLPSVESKLKDLGPDAELFLDIENMSDVLHDADLVIGSGGVSLLERMACGIPSVTICTAANQRLSIEGGALRGGTRFAGLIQALTPEALATIIAELIDDSGGRAAMAGIGRELIDGRGAERIAMALVNSKAYQCTAPRQIH
jgi:UDP-2,4-diacetamido-2,4,6-trideoxy-beta-L-altropyranose hydrolase